MLLPLDELQDERRELQPGEMNMPSISSMFKDTGEIEFTLEESDKDSDGGNTGF